MPIFGSIPAHIFRQNGKCLTNFTETLSSTEDLPLFKLNSANSTSSCRTGRPDVATWSPWMIPPAGGCKGLFIIQSSGLVQRFFRKMIIAVFYD